MTPFKVSIALCTYNGEPFLLEQLQSYVTQTRRPDELVVCDDMSSDHTLEILNEFARQAPFPVRVIANETNLRSTKNFEKAIGLCEGDIIFLSDQDDVWCPDKLERILMVFAENTDVGAVFTDGEVVDSQLESLGYGLWNTFFFTLADQKRFRSGKAVEVLLKNNVVTGATMAFRSKFRPLVLPIPATWIHDGWIAFLIATVARIEFIAASTLKYRQHATNQIGGLRKSLLDEIEMASSTNSNAYVAIAEQYEELESRISELKNFNVPQKLLKLVCEKSGHFRVRAQMPYRFHKRLKVVAKELVLSRYQLYSRGYKSVLKDLFRPGYVGNSSW